jgi:hypothetical protein
MRSIRPAALALLALLASAPGALAGPPEFDEPARGPLAAGRSGALLSVDGRPVQIDANGNQRRPALPDGFAFFNDTAYGPVPGGYVVASTESDGVLSTLLPSGGALAPGFKQPDHPSGPVAVAGGSADGRTVAWTVSGAATVRVQSFSGGVPGPAASVAATPGYAFDSLGLTAAGRRRWLYDVQTRTTGGCCGHNSLLEARTIGSDGVPSAPISIRTADDVFVSAAAALPGGGLALTSDASTGNDLPLHLDVVTPSGSVKRRTPGRNPDLGDEGNPSFVRTPGGGVVAYWSIDRAHGMAQGFYATVGSDGALSHAGRLPHKGVVYGAASRPGSGDVHVLLGRDDDLWLDHLRGGRSIGKLMKVAGFWSEDGQLAVDGRGHVFTTWLAHLDGDDCTVRERVIFKGRQTPVRKLKRCEMEAF